MAFTRDAQTVLVVVDMIVDSVTGFFPIYNPEEITRNAVRVREACYEAGIPVVQLQQRYRSDGLNAALNEPRQADGITPTSAVEGTPGMAIVPELDPGERDIVVNKHRWHGFFGTELLSVLHSLKAEQLLWIGGFTDACLGLSVFEGYFHDYPSALVADASSCDNEFTHKTAILTLANWVYDLTIFTTDNIAAWLAGEDVPNWYTGQHNSLRFTSGDDVDRLYAQVLAGSREPELVRR
jgi:nicotinamidase-related amidase